MDEVILTTCPRDCYDACGVRVVKRGGRIRHVRGDPAHPVSRGRLCVKCTTAYNGVLLDPAARLLSPLRRVGVKGSGHFEPVSWDAALREVAARVSGVPAETVLNAHYTGTFALLGYHFPQRFFNRLGAIEIDPDTICNKAGHVALDYMYGTSLEGFDPRTARDAAAILVWGANPSASAPHQHDHWLPESPGRVIVVDPVRTPTAASADLHLAPFPGSDAALAFALAHVIVRDGLGDTKFVAAHTRGYQKLEPVLARCTPAWGEEASGVPAALIEAAGCLYGEGRSLLWIGQGFQRQPRGGNAVRAVGLLPALSGNLGRPGTGFLYLNGAGTRALDEDYVAGTPLSRGAPEPISHMELAARLEDGQRSRALFCWNINIAASNPEQSRLRRALEREDLFTVAVDLFATDTTDCADVVLPAASFLEYDDIVASYFHRCLGAQVKAIEPLGDSLPNSEIFRRLAAAMGFDEPELHESDRSVPRPRARGHWAHLRRARRPRHGVARRRARGSVRGPALPNPERPRRDRIRARRGRRPPTPTRAIRRSAPASGRLRLLSPASPWLLNDSFANDSKLARRIGAATVTMHPGDADERGLAAGDTVVLRSEAGQLRSIVAVSDELPRGVVYSPKGRWPKREPGFANVNVLNRGGESDMGRSTTVHGVEVTVAPG